LSCPCIIGPENKLEVSKSTLLFMLGTIVALIIIGTVSGFVGQVA